MEGRLESSKLFVLELNLESPGESCCTFGLESELLKLTWQICYPIGQGMEMGELGFFMLEMLIYSFLNVVKDWLLFGMGAK